MQSLLLFTGLLSIVGWSFAAAGAPDKSADPTPTTPAIRWTAGKLVKPDAAWLAKALTSYPLSTCVVSGDKLEGTTMTPQDYVFQLAGQPDRLVRFCCGDCRKDFEKDPAKYIKMIDDAVAAKAKGAIASPATKTPTAK